MTTKIIVAMAAVGVLAGCSSTVLKDDYGSSVDSLIKAQTANPATLTSPSDAPVTGVDPDYARKAVDEMRKSVGKPGEVKEPIEMILMGSQGGG